MTTPPTSREVQILDALADTMITRTDVPPRSTLAAPVSAGDETVELNSITGFVKRGYLYWFDNTGEQMAAISDIDPDSKTLTLDYTNYASYGLTPGLAFDHDTGATVATGLMLHKPTGIDPMLRSGYPVITAWIRKGIGKEKTFHTTERRIRVHLQVHRSLRQYSSTPIASEFYNQLQQRLSMADTETVINAIDNNRHLVSNYNDPGPHAEGLGDQRSPDWLDSDWDTFIEKVETPQAVGAIEFWVRPRRFIRS